MPSDKPDSKTDVFTQSANGKTAGSYFTDGRYNRGGWSTYPSADELDLNSKERPAADQENIRK